MAEREPHVLPVPCAVRRDFSALNYFDFVNSPALFFFFRLPRIEYNAIAFFKGAGEFDQHAVAKNLLYVTKKYAALFAETGVHELLVINAAEPAAVQAARKGHLHF